MRIFMIVAFATMLFLSAWANSMDSADAGQTSPTGLTHSATAIPAQPGY
jgi:hypothetical protein